MDRGRDPSVVILTILQLMDYVYAMQEWGMGWSVGILTLLQAMCAVYEAELGTIYCCCMQATSIDSGSCDCLDSVIHPTLSTYIN